MYDTLTPMQKLASLVCRLMESRDGLPVDQIMHEYDLDDRTYRNYRVALRALPELLEAGETSIEEVRDGDVKKLRIKSMHIDEDTQKTFAPFLLASSLMGFLSGTKLYTPLEQLAKEFRQRGLRHSIRNLDNKLFAINEWPKNYKGKDELISKIVRGVINQSKLDIHYRSVNSERPKWHKNFKPYTIVLYRFGLYLVGQSEERGDKIITLSIDRMEKLQTCRETFHYPANYSPKNHFKDAFGLVTGKGKHHVELLFDKSVATQVKERKYHGSAIQKEEKDGSIRLTMKIDSLTQVIFWILSFGSAVTVAGPAELKKLVKEEVALMSKKYFKGQEL